MYQPSHVFTFLLAQPRLFQYFCQYSEIPYLPSFTTIWVKSKPQTNSVIHYLNSRSKWCWSLFSKAECIDDQLQKQTHQCQAAFLCFMSPSRSCFHSKYFKLLLLHSAIHRRGQNLLLLKENWRNSMRTPSISHEYWTFNLPTSRPSILVTWRRHPLPWEVISIPLFWDRLPCSQKS